MGMTMRRAGWVVMAAMLLAGSGAMAKAQDATQPASQQVFALPESLHSVRAAHWVASTIEAEQPNFPAEIMRTSQNASDWLQMARVTSRTAMQITSVKVGWAYALPAGLEFHQSDALTPPGGSIPQGGAYETADLQVAPRADALYLVTFVEQATLKNGMVLNADHAKISAFYKNCCTGPNAGKMPQAPPGRVQPDMPGGGLAANSEPTPDLKPISFDVVSFRRVKSDLASPQKPRAQREFPPDGDFITYHSSTIDSLLKFAYEGGRPNYFTISGEPDWVKNDLYDFTAKVAPEDVAAWKHMQLIDQRYMVQRALEEALKLKVHDDTSGHPIYELQVAKGGPKLMDYHAGDTVTPANGQVQSGHLLRWFGPLNLVGQDATMTDLVDLLNRPGEAGRVVIDKTGLTGRYDFSLLIPRRTLAEQTKQDAEDAGVPTVFEGLKQLGLQLASAKGPTRGIVVDHVERPPEN
jgi:uncharacterized protein (TIGR03435 family)